MALNLNEILLESPTGGQWPDAAAAPPSLSPGAHYNDLEADDDNEFTREARGFGWEADPSTDVDEAWGDTSANGRLDQYEVETLAYELMNVTSDPEMEQFLGKLIGSVGKKVKQVARRVAPAAVNFIKGPGRQLLARAMPMIGAAAGSIVPGLGTAVGGMAGQALGGLLGGGSGVGGGGNPLGALGSLLGGGGGAGQLAALLGSGGAGNILGSLLGGEMEGASLQEAKFDVARRLVRTLADATADAALDPSAVGDPESAARQALGRAVRANVPAPLRAILAASGGGGQGGLAPSQGGGGRSEGGEGGRWVRRGNQIILFGV